MDFFDVECLLIQITEGEIPPPDLWLHDRSGALTCAYEGGSSSFTWPAKDVAEIARRWRRTGSGGGVEASAGDARCAMRDAHERLTALAGEAGLPPADVVIHDPARAELRGIWNDEKVVLVVEWIAESAPVRFVT